MNLKKSWILIAAVVLLLTFAVSGTIAWIADSTAPVVNKFTPGKVDTELDEEVEGNIKKSIVITNKATSTVDVYVRVAVSGYYTKNGAIVRPWNGEHFTLNTEPDAKGGEWFEGSDGYYYYSRALAPGEPTANLLDGEMTYTITNGEILVIDVVHQSIQAEPASAVTGAWGVTVTSNGTISK